MEDQNNNEVRYVILTQEILKDERINAIEKIILARITGFKVFYEAAAETAELLHTTELVVQRAKRKLEKLGYIEAIEDTGRGKKYCATLWKTAKRYNKKVRADITKKSHQTLQKSHTENKDIYCSKEQREQKSAPVEKSKNGYGRADINELEDLWLAETGINIKSQMNQRRQLSNLVKKYGYEPTKTLVRRVGVAIHSHDRFAPQIATPSELTGKFSKLPRLELWENRNKAARPFGNHLERSIPDYNGAWDEKSDEERAEVSAMMREFRQKLGANSNRRTL